MRSLFYALFLLIFLGSYSCATFKPNYSLGAKDWEEVQLPEDKEPVYTVYLIGDAGGAAMDEIPPAIKLLNEQTKEEDENSAVVFLGDNIYRTGLAPRSVTTERELDEYKIKVQMDAVKDFAGRVFFIPGNHDWYAWKLPGIKRQARFVRDYLDREDEVWFPDPGCGGPVVVDLTEDLVLILIDSQWYLQDWEGLPNLNEDCESKSREVFELEFQEAVKSNRYRNIIVALHHPLFTYGPHGGQYRAKDHLFPLTNLNDNLLFPLPGVGSFFNFLRATVGHEQDVSAPQYQELRNALVATARQNGHFVFASGHEHSIQYIERDSQIFVVSGAGTKRTAVRNGAGAEFSYAYYGWAKIHYYEDGSAYIEYWVPEGDGSTGKVVFRKKILDALPDQEVIYRHYDNITPGQTITMPISETKFYRGGMWNFLFGKHYRDVYSTEVEVPVLDLATFEGGLKPVKRGGGFQTNSLRLEARDGREYTLRSVDKDATRTIPYPYNQSFAVDLVKDNFSAAHPLAAIAIPPLADAARVYHTNPQLVYVPRQWSLQEFNQEFGNKLYLLEERPDGKAWKNAEYFGNPKEVMSTRDALEEVQDEQDDEIDEPWVVRSRLFDMLIGDWDRHDDQWRWSLIDTGKIEYYRPIPRDRDQAFSNYDGFLMNFARNIMATSKQWRPFKPDIKPVRWGNYNARHFDPTFTSEMDWSDWEEAARFIQSQVTDELIDSAFLSTWPEEVYRISAPKIIKTLKKRRDNLLDIARRYYLFRSRKVDVVGTDRRELFEINRLDDERTLVRVYDTNKELEKQRLLYERTFLDSETKEINLFGLDGSDTFVFTGEVSKGPKIRAIGGPGEDAIDDRSVIGGIERKNIFYDVVGDNSNVNAGPDTRVQIVDNPLYNTYDRKAINYEYNYGSLFPLISFNPDDGLLLGGFGTYTTYGFRKVPFASRHTYSLNYAVRTSGIRMTYKGEFNNLALSDLDLIVSARWQTPLYASNFYGLGNETINPEIVEDRDQNYNRVRQRLIEFNPILTKRSPTGGLGYGPTFESIRIERTPGRFIDEVADSEAIPADIFTGLEFLGLRLTYEYTNLDVALLPTRGFSLKTEAGWKAQLTDFDRHFPYLNASFSAYQRIDNAASLIFATRFGVQHRFTNEYQFYQGATLGGTGPNANFRGMRRDRYVGKTAYYQNTDLRWKILGSGNRTLPFSVGLVGGFDYGRVWLDKNVDRSKVWHYSYGGGLWLSPFNSFILNLSYFQSDDDQKIFTVLGSYFF